MGDVTCRAGSRSGSLPEIAKPFWASESSFKKCIPSVTFAFNKREGLACDQPVPGLYVTRQFAIQSLESAFFSVTMAAVSAHGYSGVATSQPARRGASEGSAAAIGDCLVGDARTAKKAKIRDVPQREVVGPCCRRGA